MKLKIIFIGLIVSLIFSFGNTVLADGINTFINVEKPSYLPGFNVKDENESAEIAAKSVIYNIIDIILYIAGTISVIFVVVGGFMYVVNLGEESVQTKAKNTILYALIGLLVVILSYAIVENTVKYLYEESKIDQEKKSDTEKLQIDENNIDVVPSDHIEKISPNDDTD